MEEVNLFYPSMSFMKSDLPRERVENELSRVGGLFERVDHVPVR